MAQPFWSELYDKSLAGRKAIGKIGYWLACWHDRRVLETKRSRDNIVVEHVGILNCPACAAAENTGLGIVFSQLLKPL